MKLKILAALVVLTPFNLAYAQQNAETATGTTKEAGSKSEVSQKAPKLSEQQQVLDRIHAINQEEIQAGTMAEKNGSSVAVKEYGKMLKTDHESADEKVKKTAEDLKYTLKEPDAAQMAKKEEKLKSLQGKEFDTTFLKEMVRDHKDAIAELTKAEKQLKDTEAGKMIKEVLPQLKKHLTEAESLQKAEVAH